MERVLNFAAGPSGLPLPVLLKAQEQLVCYEDTGMSVMEMTHRSRMFEDILISAQETLTKLLGIPENYKILFLQGGGSTQFAMVPLNLFSNTKKADYVHTGQWSKKAIPEARKYGEVNVVASSEDKNFTYIPDLDPSTFTKDADYFHIIWNNTIYGTRYHEIPNTGNVPLIADMSSSILSESVDVSKFGLIFAGAQKNIGPSGITIVIIREDLIGHELDITPTMLKYSTHAAENSLYNTPPTFGIYMAKLMFDWIANDIGGLEEMKKINDIKASLLYGCLDESKLFKGTVRPQDRSASNVPFVLPTKELDAKFIKEAEQKGLVNLAGHRTVGGMRASIYNSMTIEGVKTLVDFMKKFEVENA